MSSALTCNCFRRVSLCSGEEIIKALNKVALTKKTGKQLWYLITNFCTRLFVLAPTYN